MVNLDLLRQRKKEMRLSFDDITERTGCSRRGIISVFNGETTCPRIDTLQKIAEVLELPIESVSSDFNYKQTEPLVQTVTPFANSGYNLTEKEQRVIEAYRKLGETMKDSILNMLENLAAENGYQKGVNENK